MKDGIVTAVDFVASVHIGRDEISIALIRLENRCFVCTGMRPQEGRLVDVVRVGAGTPWMVWREAQGVKILLYRNHGVEGIVVLVGRGWEDALDDLPSDGYGVVFLEVKFPRGCADHIGGHVEPFVGGVGFAIDCDRGRGGSFSKRGVR